MSIRVLYLSVFGFVLILMACSAPVNTGADFSHIADKDVVRVLKKAIDVAGGWENWSSVKKISYVKKSILYHPDGSTESEVNQTHRYIMQPHLKGSIIWSDSSGRHEILYSPENSTKTLNGQMVPNSEKSAYESFMSAVYVLFQPFKLLDPGTQLRYLGIDTLKTGQVVETIQAGYDPENNDNHSTSDTWYFYFDQKTGQFISNMVYHAPTYAYIENIEFTDDYPIRLNIYRESWRTDSLRNKQFLRGVFFYGSFQVE